VATLTVKTGVTETPATTRLFRPTFRRHAKFVPICKYIG
jgi:hypothetical protein